jgi:hypothetical protein
MPTILNPIMKSTRLQKSRRIFLRRCFRCLKYLFLGSTAHALLPGRILWGQDLEPPSPPGSGQTVDPKIHVNEEKVKEKTERFVNNFVKELEASGISLTEEEVKNLKEKSFKNFKVIIEDKGYKVLPPSPPTDLRIIQ